MCYVCVFFFFKQKTAYEMRISDCSSDVCSSDLRHVGIRRRLLMMHDDLCYWLGKSEAGEVRGEAVIGAELYRVPADGKGLFDILTLVIHEKNMLRWKIGRASCRERVCQYV